MAQTRQTIQNFYTQAQQKDFARNNLFRVLNINFGGGTEISFDEDDLIYAKTATLPGKDVTTQTVPYMGLDFNVPGIAKYTGSAGYQITFRCDESYDLRNRFLQVLNDTFDDADSTGNYFMPTADSVIDLALLDKELDRVSQFQLVGVAIKSVGPLNYDVTAEGTVQDFDVTITYHYFRQTA
tara:strand:- start:8683 stop:9228 length:546 start_codon:yes stop_codon:yes gene_type:complete